MANKISTLVKETDDILEALLDKTTDSESDLLLQVISIITEYKKSVIKLINAKDHENIKKTLIDLRDNINTVLKNSDNVNLPRVETVNDDTSIKIEYSN